MKSKSSAKVWSALVEVDHVFRRSIQYPAAVIPRVSQFT